MVNSCILCTADPHFHEKQLAMKSTDQASQELHTRIGAIHPMQLQAWRRMKPYERLNIAFQAYQFALETVRLRERKRADGLSQAELDWRVTRRMQADQRLGGDV